MTPSPKNILLVDNDHDVLNSVGFNLETSGYKVFTADNERDALLLLENKIIHLAIIDIRLKDDEQVDDQSGFELAGQMPDNIPFIIFTAYEDKESIHKALGKVGAHDILDKSGSNSASRLEETVQKIFSSVIKTNFGLEIKCSLGLETIAACVDIPNSDSLTMPSADDVRQILQTVFWKANEISLQPLTKPESPPSPTQSGAILTLARARYEDGWGVPVVVKFSHRDEVEQEKKNYLRIKPFLGGQRLAILEDLAYSRQVGGLVYTLIGTEDPENVRTFGEIYNNSKDTDQVLNWLNRFFAQSFGDIYKDSKRAFINITSTYIDGLHLTLDKLRIALEAFHPDALHEETLRFQGLSGTFRNPLSHIFYLEQFPPYNIFSRQCLCHGDLHSRNILLDKEGHFWLIDFARASESHVLRDFAELETDIKFSLLPTTDLTALLRFECALLLPSRFGEPIQKESFANPSIDRAYQTILGLRQIASDLIDLEGNMLEYYQALFFHTLNIIRLQHIDNKKKEHALLSGALIYQRLDDWPEWKNQSVAESSSPLNRREKEEKESIQHHYHIDVVKGDFIEGEKKIAKFTQTIKDSTVRGSIVAAESIQDSFNVIKKADIKDELKEQLQLLTQAVETMIKELPEDKAEEVADDMKRLVEEATKPFPNKKWYSVGIDGLTKAAENIGEVGKPVIELAGKVLKLLAGL